MVGEPSPIDNYDANFGHACRPARDVRIAVRALVAGVRVAMLITRVTPAFYAFSVLVRIRGRWRFGAGVVSLGFGIAVLVSGVAGVFAGAIADLLGTRRLLAAGSLLGCAGLALAATTQEGWQLVLVLAFVLGPAMAATFYEPVYVLMNRWFTAEERPKAYGVLTLVGGFSITIFTPLTRWLVDEFGWRQAMVVLGVILAAVGTLVPAIVDEPFENREELHADARRSSRRRGRTAPRRRGFWLFTGLLRRDRAFSGFSFHMIRNWRHAGR